MERGKISLGEELGLSAPLCYPDSQQRGVEEGAASRGALRRGQARDSFTALSEIE